MNILIISLEFLPFAGGAGIYCLYLSKALKMLNHSVTILTKDYENENQISVDEELAKSGINVIRKKYSKFSFFTKWPGYIKQTLKSSDFRLVILNNDASQFICSMPVVKKKLPDYITIFHGKPNPFSFFKKWPIAELFISRKNINKLISKSKYRISVSKNLEKYLKHQLKIKDITVINNCIDTDVFYKLENKNELREKLSIKPETKVLITASRLIKNKGTDKIINLMPSLLKKFTDLKLIITGDGEYKEELIKLVKHINIEENVIFTGKVNQSRLRELFNLSDVFLLLSESESFGLVFIEANSCGLPVIGSNVDGIPEAIFDGKSGFLVDQNNQSDVYNKISELLSNEEKYIKMSNFAKNRADNEFSLKNLSENFKKIIG